MPENLRSFLDQAVERTIAIFQDLQKAKNIEQESPLEKVDVLKIIKQVVVEKTNTQKIPVKFNSGIQNLEIVGNPSNFSRIISNLLNNSIESIDGGNGLITLSATSIGQSTQITIRDNGKGMTTEQLSKLGTKGFTQGKTKGSGLGFWHAQNTIESWGGKVSVKSQQGIGTEVTMVFQ